MKFSKLSPKAQQRLRLGVMVLGGVGLSALAFFLVFQSDTAKEAGECSVKKSPLATGSARMNQQEIWVYQMTTDAAKMSKRLEALEEGLSKLLKVTEKA